MIFRIFRADLRSIGRQFFALIIAVAICVLPALYAWFNIYANWDPYGSTGNIAIAVATEDPGVTQPDGSVVNTAASVLDSLRESDSIAWTFPDSVDEAIEGARRGDYYAAIILEPDFTDRMLHLESALGRTDPAMTYYENGKKNAIASKITQTAASTLNQTINRTYLQTLLGMVFDQGGEVSRALSDAEAAQQAAEQLGALRDQLLAYADAISAAKASAAQLPSLSGGSITLPDTGSLNRADAALAKAQSGVTALGATFSAQLAQTRQACAALSEALSAVESGAEQALEDAQLRERLSRAADAAEALSVRLSALRQLLPAQSVLPGVSAAARDLDALISRVDAIADALRSMQASESLAGLSAWTALWSSQLGELERLINDSLTADLNAVLSGMRSALSQLSPLLSGLRGAGTDLSALYAAAEDTAQGLDASLTHLETLLRGGAEALSAVLEKIDAFDPSSRVSALISLLGGDAEEYSGLFSALVDVSTEEIYSVNAYGTAMAPFYSVLAIWVGGVILVAILKVHVDEARAPGATEAQRYFGRFLIFLLIGQIQAAIIVWGDLHLLGVEAAHPWLLWLSAAVTSLVFLLLIYSLTLSFGDIGKAIVVVVMVLQIAGSSGSYPIEILPVIFEKIYRFFPFPYAINAMREAICGIYRQDLLIELLELGLFGVLGLLIGLVVRRPFIGMNEFVEEKLEETEVI